ncbi:MAG: NnrS family protein, partial [Verrucomicrobiales bacterium]
MSLWLLFYAGWLGFSPGIPHARLMIQGFVGGFIVGFMGTAMPRMLDAPRLAWQEVALLYAVYLGMAGSHVCGKVAWGDGLFLLLLLLFSIFFGVRVLLLRRDLPPPGFLLAGLGIASAMAGTVLLLSASAEPLSFFAYRLATLLLYHGFVLLPVMGVGAFFFPRLLGVPGRENPQDGRWPGAAWQRRAGIGLAVGLAVLATFFLEAAGSIVASRLVRAAVVGLYLGTSVPWFRKSLKPTGTLAFSLRVAVVMIVVGV